MFLNFSLLECLFCLHQCQALTIPFRCSRWLPVQPEVVVLGVCGLVGGKHVLIYEDVIWEGAPLDKHHSYCQNI